MESDASDAIHMLVTGNADPRVTANSIIVVVVVCPYGGQRAGQERMEHGRSGKRTKRVGLN